jgi:hypothetical protein
VLAIDKTKQALAVQKWNNHNFNSIKGKYYVGHEQQLSLDFFFIIFFLKKIRKSNYFLFSYLNKLHDNFPYHFSTLFKLNTRKKREETQNYLNIISNKY